MSRIERAKRAAGDLWKPRGRPWLSEETRVRCAAAVLWLLIAIAGLSGVVALVRPTPAPTGRQAGSGSPAEELSAAWAAGGFGAQAVSAYLAPGEPGENEDAFGAFLGDEPVGTDQQVTAGPSVAVAAVDRVSNGYWAVTVAAGEAGREQFWRIGIATQNGRLVAAGHPTPVAAPSVGERPDMAVTSWEVPPTDDPRVETVTGWMAAYACGQGDVSRWLAPSVRLDAITPPLCLEARLERWGAQPDGDERVLVVTEAVLDPGASEQRVIFALALRRRDGRWEVTELLPAPPLSEEVND